MDNSRKCSFSESSGINTDMRCMKQDEVISYVKHLRKCALENSLKLKSTIKAEVNDLISLLRQKEYEHCNNIDLLYNYQNWCIEEFLYQINTTHAHSHSPVSTKIDSNEEFDTLEEYNPNSELLDSVPTALLKYETNIDDLKLAIQHFGKITSVPFRSGEPKFEVEKSGCQQMFNRSSFNQSIKTNPFLPAETTSVDSFEVIETEEKLSKKMDKHQNNEKLCQASFKSSLNVSDWIDKSSDTFVKGESSIAEDFSKFVDAQNRKTFLVELASCCGLMKTEVEKIQTLQGIEEFLKNYDCNNRNQLEDFFVLFCNTENKRENISNIKSKAYEPWLCGLQEKMTGSSQTPSDNLKSLFTPIKSINNSWVSSDHHLMETNSHKNGMTEKATMNLSEDLLNKSELNTSNCPKSAAEVIKQAFSPYFADNSKEWLSPIRNH